MIHLLSLVDLAAARSLFGLQFVFILSMLSLTLAQTGLGDWASAYTKANTALAKLNNQQKAGIVTGIGWQKGPCVGNTAAASPINFPQLCLQDGPLG